MCSLLRARFTATGGRMQLFRYRTRLVARWQAFVTGAAARHWLGHGDPDAEPADLPLGVTSQERTHPHEMYGAASSMLTRR
jgi:hypothetical protein